MYYFIYSGLKNPKIWSWLSSSAYELAIITSNFSLLFMVEMSSTKFSTEHIVQVKKSAMMKMLNFFLKTLSS
jgi:hypothetical protein